MTFATTPRTTNRRRFLKGLAATGVLSLSGTAAGTAFRRPMTALAVDGGVNDTVVVSIFLRGAADGLNIVCPHGDADYYNQRGAYALSGAEMDDLDGFFGLHSSYGALLPWWNDGKMAAIQAVGSPLLTRSHFQAMPNMESGLDLGGWMGRSIGAGGMPANVSGLSVGARTSPQLLGPWSGQVIDTVQGAIDDGINLEVIRPAIEMMYANGVAPNLESDAVLGALDAIDDLAAIDPNPGSYPSSPLAGDLAEAAIMIKADIGVRAVAIDSTGWDHHSDGINRMNGVGSTLASAIAAFLTDLGPDAAARTLVLVSTEFGRTVKVNGSNGTDHGRASVMFAFGDALQGQGGGQVLTPGGWPGLSDAQLAPTGNALKVTTDFRDVYAEVAERHLRVADTDTIFPGFARSHVGLFHALGDVDGSGAVAADDVQSVLNGNVTTGTNSAGDLDFDGDVDLTDALLLAQQVGGA